ncbi:MAG: dTDP-glucose 4,6-dehydratase [Vampirovibrionales bacterium]|nr:dTDP-glucose 4,6-dehydratase [Vampirovibrionales bacterium]
MAKHILLTGGAGFIGSWLVRHLLAQPEAYRVTNLDLLTYAGNPDNLLDVASNPRYRFVEGDICDEALVSELMGDVDIVINAAAQTHVDRSISGPGIFIHTNVLGTQVLLESARQKKSASLEKFIQISTDEVYGSLGQTGLFTETSALEPSSPYSSSKASGDLIALSYFKTYGLPVCVTRCSNNYGPNQYPEKLIPLFIQNASNDKAVPVYGDGLNVRDWIHVQDHSAAVFAVIKAGRPGEVYNIGASNEQNNLWITRKILEILEKPDTLIRFVEDRLGHDRRYAIDSHKIQTELGWRPAVDFESGLRQTVQWYLDNPAWIEAVHRRATAEQAKEAHSHGV